MARLTGGGGTEATRTVRPRPHSPRSYLWLFAADLHPRSMPGAEPRLSTTPHGNRHDNRREALFKRRKFGWKSGCGLESGSLDRLPCVSTASQHLLGISHQTP